MRTALIAVAIFTGVILFISIIWAIGVIGDIASTLAEPASSVTTIEYLKITSPDGVVVEVRGLHSEVDTRLLLLLVGVAN